MNNGTFDNLGNVKVGNEKNLESLKFLEGLELENHLPLFLVLSIACQGDKSDGDDPGLIEASVNMIEHHSVSISVSRNDVFDVIHFSKDLYRSQLTATTYVDSRSISSLKMYSRGSAAFPIDFLGNNSIFFSLIVPVFKIDPDMAETWLKETLYTSFSGLRYEDIITIIAVKLKSEYSHKYKGREDKLDEFVSSVLDRFDGDFKNPSVLQFLGQELSNSIKRVPADKIPQINITRNK